MVVVVRANKRPPLLVKPSSNDGGNVRKPTSSLIQKGGSDETKAIQHVNIKQPEVQREKEDQRSKDDRQEKQGEETQRGWGHSRSSRSLLVVRRTPVKRAAIIPHTPPPKQKSSKGGKKKRQVISCVEIVSNKQSVQPPPQSLAQQIPNQPSTISTIPDVAQNISALTRQLAQINISKPLDLVPSVQPTKSLNRLLSTCTTSTVIPLDDLFYSPAFRGLFRYRADHIIRKIGEASYSEVFAVKMKDEELVVKIIPLHDGRSVEWNVEEHGGRDYPERSEVEDVLREVEVTKRMSKLPGGGFVEYKGTFIAGGIYSAELLEPWDQFKSTIGSASTRPDCFDSEQLYAVLVLNDGGIDLESFNFDPVKGWEQAVGVFWQVADSLGRAEDWARFEHRDLHEGQILISSHPQTHTQTSNHLDPSSTGIKTTIIDFGLSRLDQQFTFEPIYAELPEEVYEGVGDQWNVYRNMREVVRDRWEGFHSITNVMWLHYILKYMLHRIPSLRKPSLPGPLRPVRRGTGTRSRIKPDPPTEAALEAYAMLCKIDEAMKNSLVGKKGRVDFESAGEVVDWGRAMGWVE
ncbi:hypothetical protein TREMEDRAFT_64143 [Tremella mesenterica DSM 1558]|uniref:uncharacterized protein n=1 Tax=Tremella mesenterica (strain ATCC 24925 / CBS 8224 / DSM 1558 / NBRC 9311 / NRRL Y-6157 / RJB 2259-6 / UBC 559-6) TaxID=578456 RepID=UPI0003F48C0E|nr:uncharacterized protein TREMEDRAFT_64143 [Tremella mesenterica DSM 1558]EIW67554.1 hypothetical protein TREMEDRAFT_64143 [Tremella mesenterica DSM 1558]